MSEYNVNEELVPDAGPRRSTAAKVHTVANIVLTLLATVAFVFFAIFAYGGFDAYIGSKNFEGEGFNSDGIGVAFLLVFMLIASCAVVPLSIAGAVTSATALRLRDGLDKIIARVTLVTNAVYLLTDVVLNVVLFILVKS